MKIIRKIAALIAAAVIVLRLMVFNTFAVSAAPVIAAEELAALLGELLVSAGVCTSSELVDMSCEEMKDKLRPIVSSGTLPTDNPDAMANLRGSIVDIVTSPAVNTTTALTDVALTNWLTDFINDRHGIISTPNTDMKGGKSCIKVTYSNYFAIFYSNTYSEIDVNSSYGKTFYELFDVFAEYHSELGYLPSSSTYGKLISKSDYGVVSLEIFGDWRYTSDGSPAETDDEAIPVIGEAAGTAVTPDMLNPDGTVTIDGTTYYPKDFIDWDKFKDTAIIGLLGGIINTLDNSYTVVQDKDSVQDMVGDVSIELDAAEFNNLQMPFGIADVFPFCLPFDFVRGFKGLIATPQIPVFKSELDLTDIFGYDLGKHTIEVSFEKWEPAVRIFRWFSLLLFSYVLILITGKIVKGAGA